jgi:hypothetical protein
MSHFDIILSLGTACGSTHICREFRNIYKTCSPFDWLVSSPKSAVKLISLIYSYEINDIVQKVASNLTDDNRNPEFDLWFPHYTNEEFISKLERRLYKFKNLLYCSDASILLTYIGQCNVDDKLDKQELIKISKLISLFRPLSSYKIVLIENNAVYDVDKIEEYREHNIEYLKVDKVELEKFWIYPCYYKIKEHFNL